MKKVTLLALGFAFLFLCSPHGGLTASGFQKISPQTAKTLMADTPTHILLDVRTDEEYTSRHIQGARLLPHTEIAARATRDLPDKTMLIIVYCRTGTRSAIAATQLVRLGYTNVYDLGSIYDWADEIVKK